MGKGIPIQNLISIVVNSAVIRYAQQCLQSIIRSERSVQDAQSSM